MVIAFTVLAITGLPQKFGGTGWAEAMIAAMGGIELTRLVHHAAAMILLLSAIYHLVSLLYQVIVHRVRWTMYPQLQDALDAVHTVLYDLGMQKQAPKYDHFGWGEKFEYWALAWGTVVMAITGFMMWNPIILTHFLAGDVIPAAKAAHGGEAILAVLAVLVWHFYNVHLKEFNRSMFTGNLSPHEMEAEHALEFERLAQGKTTRTTDPRVLHWRRLAFVPIAVLASLAFLLTVLLFTTAETTALQTIRPLPGQLVQVYVPQTKTPELQPTAIATGQAVAATTGGGTPTARSAAPAVPADHAGRTVCTACHGTGLGGAPKSPPNHAGRLDAACLDCHKPQ